MFKAKRMSTKTILQFEVKNKSRFGILFDIDGVITRGKKLIPSAKKLSKLLCNEDRDIQVPLLFVTNAETHSGNISPPTVLSGLMSRALCMTSPPNSVYSSLYCRDVTSLFHDLDMVDHRRRRAAPCAFEAYFPRIEAVILFGEPVRWETNLQLIIDVLMTNGLPIAAPREIPYPHLPILACNMDLLWMAEASMPRFGHGCFLHCLESLYQKISGRELKYTALIGKPSELTYHMLTLARTAARALGMGGMDTIYCIGDNPETDIYGANLYNRYLQKKVIQRKKGKLAG
ncbi:hypothetical protein ScPMuIL_008141 [Solemya velum]